MSWGARGIDEAEVCCACKENTRFASIRRLYTSQRGDVLTSERTGKRETA